jgi:NitT/TauT family transport system permease protein
MSKRRGPAPEATRAPDRALSDSPSLTPAVGPARALWQHLEAAIRKYGLPLGFSLAMVGIWYLLSLVLLSEDRRFLLPPLHDVWNEAFADAETRGELLDGIRVTAKESFTGLAIAVACGMLFAVAMNLRRWVERSFFPWAVVLQTIPILALVPLIGGLFGFDFQARVIVTVLIALFPIITNTLFGLQSAEHNLHELLTLHKASRATRFWKLEFPASLPATFTGLRIAAGLSVIGAIVGEFFFGRGEKGIGVLIDKYRGQAATKELIAALLVSSLLGILVFWGFSWLGRISTQRWHASADEAGV